MANDTMHDFDNPGKTVIRPIRLAHLVFYANDFKKMRDFYMTFLNGKMSFENDMLAFITYDDEHHRVAFVNRNQPGKVAPEDATFAHVAFTFATLEDLFMAYRQRLEHGIKPFWCINHGPTISLYYRDPENNTIETQFDVFENADDATAFMLGPEYAKNPIGVDFDPEEFIAKIRKGEARDALLKRPDIGSRGPESVPK